MITGEQIIVAIDHLAAQIQNSLLEKA
jgi:hypothetical protein